MTISWISQVYWIQSEVCRTDHNAVLRGRLGAVVISLLRMPGVMLHAVRVPGLHACHVRAHGFISPPPSTPPPTTPPPTGQTSSHHINTDHQDAGWILMRGIVTMFGTCRFHLFLKLSLCIDSVNVSLCVVICLCLSLRLTCGGWN